jgi:hypothetical protein
LDEQRQERTVMQPEYSDVYADETDIIRLRADHFEDRDPVIWIEMRNYAVPMDVEHLLALCPQVNDLVADLAEDGIVEELTTDG